MLEASKLGADAQNLEAHIRVRSFTKKELQKGVKDSCLDAIDDSTLSCRHARGCSTYKCAQLLHQCSQHEVFKRCGQPVVEDLLSGRHVLLLAYGQSGSGKTYTMYGELAEPGQPASEERGLVPRLLETIFDRLKARNTARPVCTVSMLEVHNEEVYDLLTGRQDAELKIQDGRAQGLVEVEVKTVDAVMAQVGKGVEARRVAETRLNHHSSRSHSVLTFTVKRTMVDAAGSKMSDMISRLHLVDLAGSESSDNGAVGASKAEKDARSKEACNINKSLLTLSAVVKKLAANTTDPKEPTALVATSKTPTTPAHVPYRDSKLTHLLQRSLEGNSRLVLIATVSPSNDCAAESNNTLKFAERAACIRTVATVNLQPHKRDGQKHEFVELWGQLQEQRAETTRLESELASSEAARAASQAAAAGSACVVAELEEKQQQLVGELAARKEELVAVQAEAASAAAAAAAEIAQLRPATAALQALLAAKESEAEGLAAQNAALQASAAASNASMAELQGRLAVLEEQVQAATAVAAAARDKQVAATRQAELAASLVASTQALQSELAGCKQQLASAHAQLEEAKDRLAQELSAGAALRTALGEREGEVCAVHEPLSQELAAMWASEGVHAERAALASQLAATDSELAAAQCPLLAQQGGPTANAQCVEASFAGTEAGGAGADAGRHHDQSSPCGGGGGGGELGLPAATYQHGTPCLTLAMLELRRLLGHGMPQDGHTQPPGDPPSLLPGRASPDTRATSGSNACGHAGSSPHQPTLAHALAALSRLQCSSVPGSGAAGEGGSHASLSAPVAATSLLPAPAASPQRSSGSSALVQRAPLSATKGGSQGTAATAAVPQSHNGMLDGGSSGGQGGDGDDVRCSPAARKQHGDQGGRLPAPQGLTPVALQLSAVQ